MASVSRRRFAVIFTIDISHSIEERISFFSFTSKWKSLKGAVNKLLSGLDSSDLVSSILLLAYCFMKTSG